MREPDLDPVIHQPQRLRILAALARNRQASFTALRDGLGLTAGNLASHASKLEAAGYIMSGRVLAGLHFEVRYRITPKGSEAFSRYLESLRTLLQTPRELDRGAEPLVPESGLELLPGTDEL